MTLLRGGPIILGPPEDRDVPEPAREGRVSRTPTMTIIAGLGLLAAATLWSVGETPTSFAATKTPSAAAKPGPVPLARGPEADFNLTFSAQVAGWIEPCG